MNTMQIQLQLQQIQLQLTHSLTQLSPSWEATSCAATQELLNILMESEGSLPCSQELSTGPYPESAQSNPYHNYNCNYIN
jgi:hypothetical protein